MDNRVRIRVRVDDDTTAGLTRVRASLGRIGTRLRADFTRTGSNSGDGFTGGFSGRILRGVRDLASSAGQQFGSMFTTQAGEGLSGMMKNPYVLAAVASLAFAVASALAAALAGAMALAFGGAFVGLGVMLLKDQPEVKKKWGETFKDIKTKMTDAAKPLLPAIEEARVKLEGMVDKFAPHFKSAMEGATPAITGFIDTLSEGFEKFGKKAFKPMMDAFNVMIGPFGTELSGMFSTLGKSFAALGNTVKNHSVEIQGIFHVLLGLIPLCIDSINFLANSFFLMVKASTAGFGYLLKFGITPMVDGFMTGVGLILKGASAAFGWIPGIGGKIKKASDAWDGYAKTAHNTLTGIGNAAIGFGAKLDRMNKERVLKMNIATWKTQLTAATKKLKSVPASKRAKLTANINDLKSKINAAKRAIAGLHNKTVTVSVKLKGTPMASKAYADAKALQTRASGGFVGAAAGGGPRSNSVLVGEQGPEIVNLPPGSRVRSNADSRRLAGGGGGNPGVMIVQLNIGDKRLGEVLIDPLKKTIRGRGGINAALSS